VSAAQKGDTKEKREVMGSVGLFKSEMSEKPYENFREKNPEATCHPPPLVTDVVNGRSGRALTMRIGSPMWRRVD
jgi:hypothetical protein